MIRLFYLFSLITMTCCTQAPKGYVINGFTSDISDNTVVYLSKNNADFDSTLIINNQFSFEGKVESDFSNIWIHTKDYKEIKSMWVVNSEITFDASNSSFQQAVITGSRIQIQSHEYEKATALFDLQRDSIWELMRVVSSDSIKHELRKQNKLVSRSRSEVEVKFIRTHPEYELSAYFLTYLKNDIEKEITKDLYEGLAGHVKNSDWGEEILLHIEKSKILKIGDKAIDFSLSNINGDPVSLSDFKGKYVLLEFWGSRCGPCRLENPNLLKAYKEFNNFGFEILGVTMDEQKMLWESTIKKDSIIWTTVGDLKGISGVVPITYSVSYLPKNYLLNEDGIVIAENLRGVKLQEELENIFRGKTNANRM